ncbi:hypothetical protein L6R53_07365 [Myxococcota bacterium]|nr:hypothetical protein [Myxococcota bacterium]
MDPALTLVDTVLVAGAILGPLLALLLLVGVGDRLPTTGAAPVVAIVQWALGVGLGLYVWASALGKVKAPTLQGQELNTLQLWLLGWVGVATSTVLALGFWRQWRREPEEPEDAPRDLVRWGRDRR